MRKIYSALRFWGIILLGSGIVLTPHVAVAESETEIFEQVFENPRDLLLNMRLAASQIDNGNVKGAIATLERVLIFAPGFADAERFLMEANLRIGNRVDAYRYAELLASNPDASETQRTEAEVLIRTLDEQDTAFSISGSFSVGGGVHDNPDGGSKGNRALINGAIGMSDKRAKTEEYISATTILDMRYAFEDQRGKFAYLTLSGNTRDYSVYDIGDSETLSAGLGYVQNFASRQVSTFVSAARTDLDDKHYLNAYSVSASVTQPLALGIIGSASTTLGRNVYKTDYSPTSPLKTGNSGEISLRLLKPFSKMQLGLALIHNRSWLTEKYNNRNRNRIMLDLTSDILFGSMTGYIAYHQDEYHRPNTSHGNRDRNDLMREYGFNYSIGLESLGPPKHDEVRLNIHGRISNASSTIDNYATNSGEIGISLTRPF